MVAPFLLILESQFTVDIFRKNIIPRMLCLETVQDFFDQFGLKPIMHLMEISIFLLNNDLFRLTKIMNMIVKDLKILSFKVILKCLKLIESFKKKLSVKNI